MGLAIFRVMNHRYLAAAARIVSNVVIQTYDTSDVFQNIYAVCVPLLRIYAEVINFRGIAAIKLTMFDSKLTASGRCLSFF